MKPYVDESCVRFAFLSHVSFRFAFLSHVRFRFAVLSLVRLVVSLRVLGSFVEVDCVNPYVDESCFRFAFLNHVSFRFRFPESCELSLRVLDSRAPCIFASRS